MTATPLTWTRGSGLIMFTLSIPSSGEPAATTSRCAALLFELIPTVGAIHQVSLSTYAAGEDAFEWAKGQLDPAEVTNAIDAHADAWRVMFECDLICRDVTGAEIRIPDAMTLWIEFGDHEHPDPGAPLELTLSVDTDIYAARSWGPDRDNRVLAHLNAPVFNRFLQELAARTGGAVTSVDADDYRGQVDTQGFVLP